MVEVLNENCIQIIAFWYIVGMKFTKGSKPFPIGSLILTTNRRAWCKELEAWEELNISCIRAAPTEKWLRMMMNKASGVLFKGRN